MDQDPHDRALFEARIRNINSAVRVYWKTFKIDSDTNIRCGFELILPNDMEVIDSSEFSNFVDNIFKHVVELKLSDKTMISDHVYNMLAKHYNDRDITIEITNSSNELVLTTFYFNNPLAKEK
jgi:hypothetical protein